jgi:hypothetical protein
MNKNNKNLLKILILIAVILGVYLISALYFPQKTVKPSYDSYEQGNRLERIRKGLTGK